jgi:hypothetical protein
MSLGSAKDVGSFARIGNVANAEINQVLELILDVSFYLLCINYTTPYTSL